MITIAIGIWVVTMCFGVVAALYFHRTARQYAKPVQSAAPEVAPAGPFEASQRQGAEVVELFRKENRLMDSDPADLQATNALSDARFGRQQIPPRTH